MLQEQWMTYSADLDELSNTAFPTYPSRFGSLGGAPVATANLHLQITDESLYQQPEDMKADFDREEAIKIIVFLIVLGIP